MLGITTVKYFLGVHVCNHRFVAYVLKCINVIYSHYIYIYNIYIYIPYIYIYISYIYISYIYVHMIYIYMYIWYIYICTYHIYIYIYISYIVYSNPPFSRQKQHAPALQSRRVGGIAAQVWCFLSHLALVMLGMCSLLCLAMCLMISCDVYRDLIHTYMICVYIIIYIHIIIYIVCNWSKYIIIEYYRYILCGSIWWCECLVIRRLLNVVILGVSCQFSWYVSHDMPRPTSWGGTQWFFCWWQLKFGNHFSGWLYTFVYPAHTGRWLIPCS